LCLKIHFFQRDTETKPPIEEKDIKVLVSNDGINAAKMLALSEMRKLDKLALIDFFGDEQFIALLREFMPFIYEPLYDIYRYADVSSLVESLFQLTKSCIQIAETGEKAAKNIL
jgi:hypothetical protein